MAGLCMSRPRILSMGRRGCFCFCICKSKFWPQYLEGYYICELLLMYINQNIILIT